MKNEPLERLAGVSRAKLSKNRSAKVGAAEETVMTNKSRDGQGAKTAPQGKDQPAPPAADLAELSEQMGDIAERSRHLVAEFLKRQGAGDGVGMANPLSIGAAFFEMTARMS